MTMKSPAIDNYLGWLGRIEYRNIDNTFTYDKRSYELIDEIFKYLRMLEPINEHGTKELWLTSERGTIDDFEDLDEVIADGAVKNAQELNDWWLDLFPEEEQWYHLMAGETTDLGYKSIFINNRQIIEVDSTKERGFEHDISLFLEWILSAVKRCIDELKEGTYNERINKGIPYEHRIGTIVRNDLYDIFPDLREQFFADISKTEISEFIDLASKHSRNREIKRIHRFTANEFYKCCALGYEENGYDFTDLPPKEQYYKHSDGRDDGLSEIDGDSVEEFIKWYNQSHIGHPWEVCRGGNSTHVSLYVDHNDKGFCLYVEGGSIARCIEAIKFYLALKRAGYPVSIVNAEELIARLNEIEKIGIVPTGVTPVYCGGYFPKEKIIDFMNLPFKERDKVVEKSIWKPLREIQLISIE